jgi:hypothetical protein
MLAIIIGLVFRAILGLSFFVGTHIAP